MIKKIKILLRWLSENKISYLKNFELKKESWLEAGGIIKTFIRPSDEESCQNLIKFLKKNQNRTLALAINLAKNRIVSRAHQTIPPTRAVVPNRNETLI